MDRDINEGKTVHEVLAHSYLSFFIFCLLGLFLDLVFPLTFTIPHVWTYAALCLVVGPIIIIWAQRASHAFNRDRIIGLPVTTNSFARGPYKFVRNPTHIGIVLLVLGYAILTNSAILFAMTLLAVLISNRKFRQHEKILERKYGEVYKQYQRNVHTIM